MSLLRLENVGKSFGGLAAVQNVSFAVAPGEVLGLMGANGAGKTTLFNMISGVIRCDAGAILFDGRPIQRLRPDRICRLGIARTYQIVRPFPGLTVKENVIVGALYGAGRRGSLPDAERIAEAALHEAQLDVSRDSLASDLTLAGRKRLEIARALACEPRLLMLDEVLAGLTPTEVERSLEMLKAIASGRKLSIVMVEHNMRALMGFCERIVVLHHGEMIAEGTPAQVSSDENVIAAYLGAHP